MPFINTKTTVKIDSKKRELLTSEFGKAIELIPGKSEKWLMLNFDDECKMAFAGNLSDDSAILEVKIFGSTSKEVYDSLTSALTKIIVNTLGISPERIYVKYEEYSTWGWNGINL